ncbi:MAG: hypothetical protein DCC52_04170 [Chloroflexi bacterium]|nr:MAG: hypothetical protein DCC52_04170 [Chloroflexota bacterium]
MRAENKHANRVGAIARQRVGNMHQAAEMARHFFLARQMQQRIVHPIARKFFARKRFGLRDFVFVMRKHDVKTAAMQINLFAVLFQIHRGTFNVPAGATRPPRRIPRGFARFGRFPQRKIHRVFFALVHRNARARFHFVERTMIQLAVIGIGAHAKINVAVHRVRHALFNQPARHFDNGGNRFGRARINVGALDIERVHFAQETRHVFFRQRLNRRIFLFRGFDDAVFNVGKILNVLDDITAKFQIAFERIKNNVRQRVTDMRGPIQVGSADIQRHMRRLARHKFLFLARERVVKIKRHCLLGFLFFRSRYLPFDGVAKIIRP